MNTGKRKREEIHDKEIIEKVKKPKKKKKKKNEESYSSIFGANIRPTLSVMDKKDITTQELQQLLRYIQHADERMPKWCTLSHKHKLHSIAVIVVPAMISQDVYALPKLKTFVEKEETTMKRLVPTWGRKSLMDVKTQLDINVEYSQFCKAMLLFQLKIKEKKKKKEKQQSIEKNDEQLFDIKTFCITIEQLLENKYPMEDQLNQGYIRLTKQSKKTPTAMKALSNDHPLFELLQDESSYKNLVSIDCEMVKCKEKLELARITIVAWNGDVIYDTLVKPENKVDDYLTKYSGIHEAMLTNVTTTLKDIQTYLLDHFTEDTYLVGHGLENDLHALQLVHEKILDTSLLYVHPSAPLYKHKLKYLSSKHCQYRIQQAAHDSAEDAIAALALAKLKLKNGLTWGNYVPKKTFHNLFDYGSLQTMWLDNVHMIPLLPKHEKGYRVIQHVSEFSKALQPGTMMFTSLHHLKDRYMNATNQPIQEVKHQLDETLHQLLNAAPSNSLTIICSPFGNLPGFNRVPAVQKKDEALLAGQGFVIFHIHQ